MGTGLVVLRSECRSMLSTIFLRNTITTVFGILILAWGGLELARAILHILFESPTWIGCIFAILLIGLGLILSLRGFLRSGTLMATLRRSTGILAMT